MEGALFGPLITTWYGFLHRIKFSSPTKAVVYRVSVHITSAGLVRAHLVSLGRFGWIKRCSHPVRSKLYLRIYLLNEDPVGVMFFYGAMSVLEGKPQEAIDRIQRVRTLAVLLPRHTS